MRQAPGFTAIALLLILGIPAHAELWCGHGPGTPLDHPCSEWDTEADPAVAAAIDDNFNEWTSIPGVWQVKPGTELSGDPNEIRIYVEPKHFASAKLRLPSQVGNIAIVVIAKPIPAEKGPFSGIVGWGGPTDPELAEQWEKARRSGDAYEETRQKYTEFWDNLPGVVGMAPVNCEGGQCDFSAIEITVQAQLMDSVKEQIPNTINGITIIFRPYEAEGD